MWKNRPIVRVCMDSMDVKLNGDDDDNDENKIFLTISIEDLFITP